MPARLRMVSRWSDLEAAGGTHQSALWPWMSLETTYRVDGDDRLVGRLSNQAPGAQVVAPGEALRLERADDSIEEWIVTDTQHALEPGEVSVTALPARVWLEERVMVQSGTVLGISGTGTVEEALDALIATDNWPPWLTRGTVTTNPTITYDWRWITGLAALMDLVAQVTAAEEVAGAGEVARLALRRVSGSAWELDILTGAGSACGALIAGRNLTGLTLRSERVRRASAIYPVNEDGASIGEAMLVARSVSGNVIDVADWSWRMSLAVAFDDQWVGWYAVAPDGTESQIVASNAALQQIEVADATAWGAGDNTTLRIRQVSSGPVTLAAVDTDLVSPRGRTLVGRWTAAINWAPNARFDAWVSTTQPEDYALSGGLLVNRVTDIELGTYAIEFVTGGSIGELTAKEVRMPDAIVSNNGGTQTWRVGIRSKRTANTGGQVLVQYSKNSGSSWTTLGPLSGSGTFATTEWTFTTTAADLPHRPRLRFHQPNATAGSKWVLDRLWLFRDGVDTGDTTLLGNGPNAGFFDAQRVLLQERLLGTSYEMRMIDRYRAAPSSYPNEQVEVGHLARFIVPRLGMDFEIPVVQLVLDELHPTITTATLGALRRRLTDSLRG